MTYGFGMGTGLRGLTAARLAMQVIGQNVSNVNTPGYSRQRVLLAASLPQPTSRGLLVGSGVDALGVQRILDERLDTRIRSHSALFGRTTVQYQRLDEVERMLGEPGEFGISSRLSGFFGAVGKLRADAGSRALRGGVIQSASSLTDSFQQLGSRLGKLGEDTLDEVQGYTKTINAIAEEVASINKQIISLEASGHEANDLRDQRDQALSEIAELIDIKVLDRATGSVDVIAGDFLLVSGARASKLDAAFGTDGKPEVRIAGSTTKVQVRDGKIAGLLDAENASISGLNTKLDRLARNLILEVNRIHSTGMARGGPFTTLVADTAIVDGDGDGQYSDELLSAGGLPFEIQNGELWVAVTELSSGDVERTKVTIDPASTTLGELATEISKISNLNASVDPNGRLRLSSSDGFGFDFSQRLDSAPNTKGTFGGKSATLGASSGEPWNFANLPATFQIAVDGGANSTITLQASDFQNPTDVDAQELTAVLNGKFNAASLGARAVVVGDRIALQSGSTGTTSSLRITDGTNTPAATIGLPVGVTATGQANGVAVAVSGSYNGKDNGHYRFVAEGNGQIGVTQGLTIGVFDQDGAKVATLEVGQGYSPGDKLQVGQGIEVAFGPGNISSTAGEQFALDTIHDSDTSDILVALGLNAFFTGSGASDIAVSDRILNDADQLAAGLSLIGNKASVGDADNLIRMEGLRDMSLTELDSATLESFWLETASEVGFETKKARSLLQSEERLHQFLEAQREAVSGVDIDEEMVDLVRYQQAYQAASRFISVMSDMADTLISLGR